MRLLKLGFCVAIFTFVNYVYCKDRVTEKSFGNVKTEKSPALLFDTKAVQNLSTKGLNSHDLLAHLLRKTPYSRRAKRSKEDNRKKKKKNKSKEKSKEKTTKKKKTTVSTDDRNRWRKNTRKGTSRNKHTSRAPVKITTITTTTTTPRKRKTSYSEDKTKNTSPYRRTRKRSTANEKESKTTNAAQETTTKSKKVSSLSTTYNSVTSEQTTIIKEKLKRTTAITARSSSTVFSHTPRDAATTTFSRPATTSTTPQLLTTLNKCKNKINCRFSTAPKRTQATKDDTKVSLSTSKRKKRETNTPSNTEDPKTSEANSKKSTFTHAGVTYGTTKLSPEETTLKDNSSIDVIDVIREPGHIYCEPVTKRGIYWPLTLADTKVSHDCPTNTSGTAAWFCDRHGKWWPRRRPDLRECKRSWSVGITEVSWQHNARHVLSALYENAERDIRRLYGGDIITVSNEMRRSIKEFLKEVKNVSVSERQNLTEEISQLIFNVSDTVLSPSTADAWYDIPSGSARRAPALEVMQGLEEGAFLLGKVIGNTVLKEEKRNYVMEVMPFSQSKSAEKGFSFPAENMYETYGASIQLPVDFQTDVETSLDGSFNGVFIAYSTLYGMLARDAEDDEQNATKYMGSKVISASLQSPTTSLHFQNGRQVKMTFRKDYADGSMQRSDDALCVFWEDSKQRTGESDESFWSTDGCSLLESNTTHAVCQCNHLTNFAILLDVSGASKKISDTEKVALDIITYIGCWVSIVCLIMCIFTFSYFKTLYCIRNTIHRNLCICLLLGELVFVIGADKTSDKIGCKVVAVLLHLLFLSAFFWMCLEGVQMYLMLVRVFNTRRSVVWYYLAGYGFPFAIVAFSFGFMYDGYGSDFSCWLNVQNYTILAFAVPVGCVLIVNMIILFISMRVVIKQTRRKVQDTGGCQISLIGSWVKGSIVLVSLLGCTWAVGFFFISQATVVFAYIFTILNTSQGLFIFIFHCCINESVRSQYKSAIMRSTCCPLSIKDKLDRSSHYIDSRDTCSGRKRSKTQSTSYSNGSRHSREVDVSHGQKGGELNLTNIN